MYVFQPLLWPSSVIYIYWYYSMPHYIVILHALRYLSISFTINFYI